MRGLLQRSSPRPQANGASLKKRELSCALSSSLLCRYQLPLATTSTGLNPGFKMGYSMLRLIHTLDLPVGLQKVVHISVSYMSETCSHSTASAAPVFFASCQSYPFLEVSAPLLTFRLACRSLVQEADQGSAGLLGAVWLVLKDIFLTKTHAKRRRVNIIIINL